MSCHNDCLFRDVDLSDVLRAREEKLRLEIDEFGSDYLLKVSIEDLTSHLADKYRLEPIVLLRDQIYIAASGDSKVDVSGNPRYSVLDPDEPCYVPGTFAEFAVPFAGDQMLFLAKPSSFDLNPPRAQILGQELRFRYTRTDHDHAAMRGNFDSEIEKVLNYLSWGREQVDAYNKNSPQEIRQRLNYRKDKFLKDKGLVEALGFPIKPRAGASLTYTAAITRKRLPIQKPTVASGPFNPEPVLETENYDHILGVISNMILVMERKLPGRD